MDNQSTEVKIGLLLPKSSLYPALGMDIRDGLKGALGVGGCNYRLLFENIGNGASEAVNYEKAERLLLQEEVAAVVAYMDYGAAIKLEALFAECKRPLIVLDPGVNPPLTWQAAHPFLFTFSLQGALNSYITGGLAARNGAQRVIFSTSFYEGGYLHCSAYQDGLAEAGGRVLYHSILPLRQRDFKPEQLHEAIRELQPDTVLAQFSAESGAFFLEQYKEAGLPGKTRLYLSSFMLEESWIGNIAYPFDGMTGLVAWSRWLDTEENRRFTEVMQDDFDKEANVFSLLGWEAGLLVSQLIRQHTESGNRNLSKTAAAFRPQTLQSPRGRLELHGPTGVFFGPAYLVEVIRQETTGNCSLQVLEELSYDPDVFMKEIPEGSFSRWNNTYLCI